MNGDMILMILQVLMLLAILGAAWKYQFMPLGMQVQQIVDKEQEEEDDKLSEDELRKKFLGEEPEKPDPAKVEPEKKEPAATNKPEPEYRYDHEKNELVIVTEEDETDAERAEREAQKLTGDQQVKPPTAEEVAAAVDKLQAEYDKLAKENPALAAIIPADLKEKGLKGLLEQYQELAGKVQQQEQEVTARKPVQVKMDQQTRQYIEEQTVAALVGKELPEGVKSIPKDKKEWWKLWDENPGGARELERIMDETREEVKGQVQQVAQALQERPAHNDRVAVNDWKKIEAEAKRAGIIITQDQFIAWARPHINSPEVTEIRHGVEFLKENALLKLWRFENNEKILDSIRTTIAADTRKKTVETLQGNKPTTVVLGATAQGTGRVKRETRIRLDDDAALDKLTPAQLEALYRKSS